MWKSKKFNAQATAAVSEAQMVEQIKARFDFAASEDSDPSVLTASDVLKDLGIEANRNNATMMGKVLRKMVGDQRRMRLKGTLGRYYALPPRKESWL